jgi:hypothetical protein
MKTGKFSWGWVNQKVFQPYKADSLVFWKSFFDLAYFFQITPYRFQWNEEMKIWEIVSHQWQQVRLSKSN